MSSYIFTGTVKCRFCAACIDGECTASRDGGCMVHPETGEVLGYAETLHQDFSGRAYDVCEETARYWGYFCEDDCEYHEDAIYNYSDHCHYSPDYALNSGYMAQCQECGDWYDADEVRGGCCDCCRQNHRSIQSYHAAHYRGWEKVGDYDDTKTIGFELETDGDYYDPESAAAEIMDTFGYTMTAEEDCSLSQGVEFISQPHTLEAMRNFDFDSLVNICADWSADPEPYTCGFHVHFDRSWFGDSDEEQRFTIARVILAYRNNWDNLVFLSRRQSDGQIDNYSRYPAGGSDVDEIISNNCGSRYYAVNLQNSNTVEFRLGAGVLDAEFLRQWIELHVQIVEACRRGDQIYIFEDCIYTEARGAAA